MQCMESVLRGHEAVLLALLVRPRSPFPSLLNVATGRPGYFAERRMTLKFSVLMGFIENRVNQVSGPFSQFLIHSVS